MITNEFQSIKSWAFEEARKLYSSLNGKIPEKGYVLFCTGYSPSGLPHIGTFTEIVRTNMCSQAFRKVSNNMPIKLLCFSDDIDGMRKIPDTIANKKLYEQYLGYPLTAIPDPFGNEESFALAMNKKMITFFEHFGCEYEFKSSTQCYQSGLFNEFLIKVLHKYDEIMAVMLPTLGPERQATYSPFMPICPETNQVLQVPTLHIDKEKNTITYENLFGKKVETEITNGKCKLQWKVDFGMRWACLDVDYEMYGKDHLANGKIYSKICSILGGKIPQQMFYEMFLDKDGKKISKSKGNGVTLEQWLRYAPEESLSLFAYQNPQRAKKLDLDQIPKIVDEYLTFLSKYHKLTATEKYDSPIYHIHFASKVHEPLSISYGLILNLIEACGSTNSNILKGYIKGITNDSYNAFLDKMLISAANYYHDFIAAHKSYRPATEIERNAMLSFAQDLSNITDINDQKNSIYIQNILYNKAKEYNIDMKLWFQSLYEVLLGASQGPRFGSFVALYGVDNTINLIRNKLSV